MRLAPLLLLAACGSGPGDYERVTGSLCGYVYLDERLESPEVWVPGLDLVTHYAADGTVLDERLDYRRQSCDPCSDWYGSVGYAWLTLYHAHHVGDGEPCDDEPPGPKWVLDYGAGGIVWDFE